MTDDSRSALDRVGNTLRGGMLMIALGALLYAGWRSVDRTRRSRSGRDPAQLPERLQTWEAEGGRPVPDPEPGSTPAL